LTSSLPMNPAAPVTNAVADRSRSMDASVKCAVAGEHRQRPYDTRTGGLRAGGKMDGS